MKQDDINLLRDALFTESDVTLVGKRFSNSDKADSKEILKSLFRVINSRNHKPAIKLKAATVIQALAETKNPNLIRILGKGLKFYREFAKHKSVKFT